MDELKQARQTIDQIDSEMAQLFAQRMAAIKQIARYKQTHGLPISDAAREEEVIQKNAARIADEEIRSYYISFLKNNMKLSCRYQQKLQQGSRVAYCGIEGSFAAIAASQIFPGGHYISCSSFSEAYSMTAAGECDCAVLPIENSSNGEVGQVLDLMMFDGSLYVNHVYEMTVVQNLLGVKGSKTDDIRRVYSHEQALGQSASFLEEHGITALPASNTAVAAKMVAEMNDPHTGAIASAQTAEYYGLQVLERHINQSDGNVTRFGVFSRVANRQAASGSDGEVNSILLFHVKDEAGALAKAVNIIGLFGYNMRVLRSRPMKQGVWQNYFYIELQGDINSETGKQMCLQLANCCDGMRIGGTYKRDVKGEIK